MRPIQGEERKQSREISIKWEGERETQRKTERSIHLGSLDRKVFKTQNSNTYLNIFSPWYGLSWVSVIYNWQLGKFYPIKTYNFNCVNQVSI